MGNEKKISAGDKVILKTGVGTGTWAIVIREKTSETGQLFLFPELDTEYEVKRLDTGQITSVFASNLIIPPKGTAYVNLNMLECTCGLKYVREGGKHSDWCFLYFQNNN